MFDPTHKDRFGFDALDRCLLLRGRTTFGTGSTYISSNFTPSCTPSSNVHAGIKVERKRNERFSKKGRQKSEGGSEGGLRVLTAETLSIISQMPHEVCGKTACLIEAKKLVDPNSTLNHDSLPSAYVHPLNLAEAIESSYPAVLVSLRFRFVDAFSSFPLGLGLELSPPLSSFRACRCSPRKSR